MIGYLQGRITHLLPEYCLLDVHGVGYRVFVASSTRSRLHVGDEALLFTYLNVREDALLLYGFYSQEEYNIFQRLISVSGIGPKVALGILSGITVDHLCQAIVNKQVAVLTKLPGIGKKSAERLILELKDKVQAPDQIEDGEPVAPTPAADDFVAEAAAALASLGYTEAEIVPVLRKASSCKTVEEIIKFALREFAGRQ